MKRIAYNELIKWKNGSKRKPLLLKGARQAGKSYLLQEFGKELFDNYHIFNFEKDKKLDRIFQEDLDPLRIINELGYYQDRYINIHTDLVIFDEIQQCPNAITSLKYFYEDMPELALCSAGSLIGIMLSSASFPVGKIELLEIFPLNFKEFLMAFDNKMLLDAYYSIADKQKIPQTAHERLLKVLYKYFTLGGMPEVVNTFLELKKETTPVDITGCRKMQKNLIQLYINDFAIHSGKTNAMHIASIFSNIPSQLAKSQDLSVKRFRFNEAVLGKKSYRDIQGPIEWLKNANLILSVKICNRAEIPLESFTKPNIFKCYIFDTGLLGCMLNLSPLNIYNKKYGITKGYFAENYIAQEMFSIGNSPLYGWNKRNSEIEFLLQKEEQLIPVEVKSGTRTQAKSLKVYIEKYNPKTSIIISTRTLSEVKNIGNTIQYIPLYAAGSML